MYRLPIEDLLSADDRNELEAVRLIALARDLLSGESQRSVRICLDSAIKMLGELRDGGAPGFGVTNAARVRPDSA
ncbi:MAG: hypothetical protein ACJASD_000192 [Sphingomonas echinoides]|jgi:hypothetical protein